MRFTDIGARFTDTGARFADIEVRFTDTSLVLTRISSYTIFTEMGVESGRGETLKESNKAFKREIFRMGGDIIRSRRFARAWMVDHHLDYNVAVHSLEVAGYALRIAKWCERHGIKVNEEDVVRACLLHDIGMTEARVKRTPAYRKAFLHPKESYKIARDEYGANKAQLDAIRRHMWPICIVPPTHLTGWIVMMADKASASREAKKVAEHKADRRAEKHARKKQERLLEKKEELQKRKADLLKKKQELLKAKADSMTQQEVPARAQDELLAEEQGGEQ